MRLFLDDTSNRGSESDFSYDYGANEDVNQNTVSNTDRELFSDEQSQAQFNTGNGASEQTRRINLIQEAKKIMRRGPEKVTGRLATRLGASKDVQNALRADTEENRAKVKEEARKKARKLAKDKIGKKIGNKAVSTGFRKGVSQGAAKTSKELAKGAAKGVAKSATKVAAKGTAQVGARAGTAAAVEGGVAAVGAATGAVSFGLGLILGLLLDIAISLGINDAVDAGFELSHGNVKQATFLAIRAAAKVGVFIYLLVTVVLSISVAGLIIAVPLLLILNIYMIAGLAFPKWPNLQGIVWWEYFIIILLDIFVFILVMAFIGGIGWYLCTTSGLGSGGVTGAVTGAVASAYDWWNSSTAGSTAQEFCKFVTPGQ